MSDFRRALIDGGAIVPRVGRVVASDGLTPPWIVVDTNGGEVEAVTRYLRELVLCDMAPGTVRAYAYGLLRWFRVLWALDANWENAQRSEVEILVGVLRSGRNPQRSRSTASATHAGSVNPRTGKPTLRDGYAPAGINHTLSVVSSFYQFQASLGRGPVINPVPSNADRDAAVRHRSPIEPPASYRRGSLRQRVPTRSPRSIPDRLWNELFEAMRCDRDRALLLLFVTSGARAEELLRVTPSDIDWAQMTFYVVSKGTRARQQVPTSTEALRMLRRYMDAEGPFDPHEPIWRTRRGARRPLTYSALRRVLQRANETLGTNWTWHDLRHTAAVRLANDPNISLAEAQTILRHANVETTGRYQLARLEDLVDRLQEHYQRPTPEVRLAPGYDPADMESVFGA